MASINGTSVNVTPTQRLYLEAIRTLRGELGRWPSLAEVAAHVDRSRTAVWMACTKLEEQGLLRRDDRGTFFPTEGD